MDADIAELRDKYLNHDFDEKQFFVDPAVTTEYARLCGETAERFLDPAEREQRQRRESRLITLTARLDALSPLSTLQRGYAIVTSDEGEHVITDSTNLSVGQSIRGRLMHGQFSAEVTGTEPE